MGGGFEADQSSKCVWAKSPRQCLSISSILFLNSVYEMQVNTVYFT